MPKDMLLIIDPQRKFIAPPTRQAMRAASEVFGASVPLLDDCAKIGSVVDNLQRAVESLRPHMEIAWAAMMDGEGTPRTVDNLDAFKKMIEREGNPETDFHELAPQKGDLIFTKYQDSVFSNRTLAQILKASGTERLFLAGFNSLECVLKTYKSSEAHAFRENGMEMAVVHDLSSNSYRFKGTFRRVLTDEAIMEQYSRLNINVVESADLIRAYRQGLSPRSHVPRVAHKAL